MPSDRTPLRVDWQTDLPFVLSNTPPALTTFTWILFWVEPRLDTGAVPPTAVGYYAYHDDYHTRHYADVPALPERTAHWWMPLFPCRLALNDLCQLRMGRLLDGCPMPYR